MRAATYARVSSAGQVNNTSIPNQLERTAAYVEGQGWELVGTFTEPGESGENLERPALAAARAAARRGDFDVLVVYTLDRLTRNIDDLFLLRREFAGLGVKVLAVHDGLDVTTADVDDLLGVLFKGYFGHRELATIRRRTNEGIERHVKDGKFAGGVPPFGYRRGDDGRLVAYEPEARLVGTIFEWATGGTSARQIARRLNGMDIPSPRRRRNEKTRRRNDGTQDLPGGWTPTTVTLILHSGVYAGRWTYGKRGKGVIGQVTIDAPAIVERATWERAQEALVRNRRNTRPPKHQYLLRGLVKCECGASFCGAHPRRPGGPYWYRCIARTDYRKLHQPEPCHSLTIRGAELEAEVWAHIEEFVRQPHLVAAELSARRGPAGEGIAVRLAEIDRATAERRAELDRYLALYGRGVIPVEQLDARAREVRGNLAALVAYREGLVEEQRRADLWEREMVGVVEALTALQDWLDAGVDFENKRAIVEDMVKEIRVATKVGEDGNPYSEAKITYRFERPDVSEAPIPVELTPLFAEGARRAVPVLEARRNCQSVPGVLDSSDPLSPFEIEREVKL